jgi:hypothetical protein
MINEEDTVFAYLETLLLTDLRSQIEIGCRRIYFELYSQDISVAEYDFETFPKTGTEVEKWLHVLKNRLVTVWQDSQNLQIVDVNGLSEEVYGVAECIEHCRFAVDKAQSLLNNFLAKS